MEKEKVTQTCKINKYTLYTYREKKEEKKSDKRKKLAPCRREAQRQRKVGLYPMTDGWDFFA